MQQSLQEYCRDVEQRAERMVRAEETCRRNEHLRAFNLGRLAQRAEKSRREAWLRVGCLLAGLIVGAACGWKHPDLHRAHQFCAKAGVVLKTAGHADLHDAWKSFLRRP
jgi:hypothetical protein